MSRSFRSRTPTFRFNRNEDDLLEEVLESNESFPTLEDETIDSINQSIGSTNNTSISETNRESSPFSGSGVGRERSSVKDFITSKLNKTKSLDEDNGKDSSITSNWFNDMKVKIKEKIDERKREKERERLLNTTDSDIKSIEGEVTTKDSSIKSSLKGSEESIQNNINEMSADYSNESIISSTDNTSRIQRPNFLIESTETETIKSESKEEDLNDSSNDFNLLPDIRKSPQLWTYSQIFNTTALMIAILSLVISVSLPVHSFIRGLLFGSVLTLILFSVLFFYIISKFFVVKSGPKKDSNRRDVLSIDVPNTVAYNEEIFKGWVYEFIGSYDERDSGFKVQLIYVRLQGSSLRLSKPKHDIKKSKLNSNSLPVFVSQRFYEFSKMSHKRVYLLLPKSVKNQKKYVWSKKYPICLELEDFKTKSINKLVLFIRNCRDKEEWFWKLRERINQTIYPSTGTSGPPTPSSTSDMISPEIECLPRTESLDLGSLQSATTCSSDSSSPTSPTKELLILSKQLDYNLFMNKIMAYKSQNTSSLLWFNALISRICFDVLNEQFWSTYIAAKIQRKLRRLRLPYFMESLTITEIDVGNTLPKFNDVPKPPVVDKRGLWIDFDITYSGLNLIISFVSKSN